ncbi:hypothetical protein H206_02463 [Candidatus Electrothrix aarhusensis]|jgi:hypothetical protein|uniref:Uncharacterized protein n=1 Tax=Candidatus Electrothrix aarhusensis TaxID=1859131 RepID=A0A3S3RMQ9_9BACT|nr:hypothetical protein H206_02463 [Candidatus Electrothrix aarhusensis]
MATGIRLLCCEEAEETTYFCWDRENLDLRHVCLSPVSPLVVSCSCLFDYPILPQNMNL